MQIKPIIKDKPSIPVVFAFNDEYCKYFAVALQSLMDNSNESYFYDIVILTSGICENNKKLLNKMTLKNFSLRFFNMKEIIRKNFSDIVLNSFEYWSVEMYYRIFIPIIMQNYEKVLYLDTDTIAMSDICLLFEMDFQEKCILAVSDTIPYNLKLKEYAERKKQITEVLKLKDITKYFNSGMLLFNIKAIDLTKYIETFRLCLKKENLLFPDQDILNIIFEDNTKFIPSEWNYCCGELAFNPRFLNIISGDYKKEYLSARANPKIVHFTSPRKPWNERLYEHFEKFWFYARKTPFYEEILYKMNQDAVQKNIVKSAKYTNLYLQIQTEKKIVLWGASLFLEEFIENYDLINDNIIGIIDKNPTKKGKFIGDYKIFAPEDLKDLNPDEIIITIVNSAKKRANEVKSYLKTMGFDKITVKTL